MSKEQSAGGSIQWTKVLKKLSPYTIQKGFRYLKHYGPKEFWIRLHERFEPEEVPYGPWYEVYIPDEETLEKQRKHKFKKTPLISIAVPAYQTPTEFLKQMIDSLIAQTYPNWELCIANASPDNEEMQRVLADYAARDSRVRFCNLLRSNNYICHFFVARRSIVEKVGGFRKEFDGAQDYDFIFRCTENSREVVHIPEILYHWRTHKASTADNPASKMYAFEAGKRAIEAHLERNGVKGVVSHTPDLGFYRVQYPVQKKYRL